MQVTVGIDSAKFDLGAGLIDEVGRTVAARKFANRAEDWKELLDWAKGFGEIVRVGVEGSGQYGAGITEWFIGQGLDVREVPAHMTFQERKRKPSLGKSDPADGPRIAAVTLREAEHLPVAGKDQLAQDLKAATEHRDQLIRSRTQHANRAHALLSVIRPGALARGTRLTSKRGVAAALKLLRGDHQLRAELVREHLAEIGRLTARITQMEGLITTCSSDQGHVSPKRWASDLSSRRPSWPRPKARGGSEPARALRCSRVALPSPHRRGP